MAIKDADAKKTFHWEDSNKGENVMYRIPQNIRWNDNVVVREDECAVFFRDGKAMVVFDRPGRYAMTTQNVPVLSTISKAVTGVQQLGEVYYIQKRELRGKFGTTEPLVFRDTDFGVVRIRVFGQFAYKISDPLLFITQFVGTEGISTSDKVIEWMKDELVMSLNDALGELKRDKQMGVVDMPAYLQELEQIILSKVESDTKRYGVKITNIAGMNINLPEEVQEAVDKRGAMSTLGVGYMQYQTGRAVENIGEGAAKGDGMGAGMVGMGAGMGAGFGMGNIMTQGMADQQAGPPQQQASDQNKITIKCSGCGTDINQDTKFCPECGKKVIKEGMIVCPKCNSEIPKGSRFCLKCGENLISQCQKCNSELPSGAKFCLNCGEKVE